jgi:1-acyl-sn-glycerol-3-phosphate acyltransferase
MRRTIRLCACLTIFSAFIVLSLLTAVMKRAAMRAREETWALRMAARLLLAVLGVRVNHRTQAFTPHRACLLVANHQSYLDIAIAAAHYPARFVAKQEVAAWPLFGLMARACGTLFLDRRSLREGVKCARAITNLLEAGINVLVFPEGTTSDGTQVSPFKPLLLNAALRAGVPVLPLTITYTAVNGAPVNAATRDVCCWYGEMEFLGHFWRLLAADGLEVTLEAHAMVEPEQGMTAQELARRAHASVASGLLTPAPQAPTNREGAPDEFLVGALLFSLLTQGQELLEEADYGETR